MLRQTFTLPSRVLRSYARTITARSVSRPQSFVATVTAERLPPAVVRWYSEALKDSTEPKEESEVAKPEVHSREASDPLKDSVVADLEKKLETKEKEALDWKDKCLRTIADFRNLQDRTQREIKSSRDFAIQSFAKDLTESIDNLDRALSMVPADKIKTTQEKRSEDLKDLINLYDGLKMTDDILQSTIKKHGLERFEPLGEKFNPNEHEALFMSPQEGKEDNTIFYVEQKGFKLSGRVLRAAKVGVVKNN